MLEIVGCICFAILFAAVVYGVFCEIKHMKVAVEKERQQTAMYARILKFMEDNENA